MGERQPSTSSKSYRFQGLKGNVGVSPLRKSFSFAYPLLLPSSDIKLSTDDVTMDKYRGNSLDIMDMGGEMTVVYPQCEDFGRWIYACRLKENSVILERADPDNHKFYRLEKYAGCVTHFDTYQVAAKCVNNTGYILARSRNQIDVYSLSGNSEKGKIYPYTHRNELTVTGADLSDVLPGYYTGASENGSVFVQDVESKAPFWECNFQDEKTSTECSFHCEFGRHPLSLLVKNESSLWLCDARVSGKRSSGGKRLLLDTNSMRKFIPGEEELHLFSQIEGMPYLYVITSTSVFVYDERYNKIPHMIWQHMLKSAPSFVTKQRFGDFEAVLLSGREKSEVCTIVNEWVHGGSSSWCRSKSLPKHVTIAEDTINFTHSEEISVNVEALEHVSSTYIGITSFLHSKNKNEMSLLSLNKYGDIFSQHFKFSENSDDIVDKEDIETGKKILNHWQEHINSNKEKVEGHQHSEGSQFLQKLVQNDGTTITRAHEMFLGLPDFATEEAACAERNSFENIWDIQGIIKKVRRSKLVKQQSQKEWLQSIVKEYIVDDSVKCADNTSPSAKKHRQIDRYFPRKIAKTQNIDFSNAPKDSLTSKLLLPWTENIPAGRGFCYHTAPLAFNRMSQIPSKMKHLDSLQSDDVNFDMYESSTESVDDEPVNTPKATIDDTQHFQVSQILSQQVIKPQKKKSNKRRVDGF